MLWGIEIVFSTQYVLRKQVIVIVLPSFPHFIEVSCPQSGFLSFLQPNEPSIIASSHHPRDDSVVNPVCMLSRFSHVWLFATHGWSLPVSSVLRILQARILKWVATPSSMGPSWPRDLSDPGIEPTFPALAGRFFTTRANLGSPWWILLQSKFTPQPHYMRSLTRGSKSDISVFLRVPGAALGT